MSRKRAARAQIIPRQMQRLYRAGERPALALSVLYPDVRLPENPGAGERIRQFYRERADEFYRDAAGALLTEALAAPGGPPSRPYRAELTFSVTFNHGGRLSIVRDRLIDTAAGRPSRLRSADTWDVRTGAHLELPELFRPGADVRGTLEPALAKAAGRLLRERPGLLYADAPDRLAPFFHAGRFYLTPRALCVFYQPCEIGPRESGVIALPLPYARLGPRFRRLPRR